MNYESAVRYLLSLGRELAAPTQAAAAKFNLENITVLMERLGRPDWAYPVVHIAGTNGKGSTAAFLEAILRDAGFHTGLNTSPHLERINERVRINGDEISDEKFAATFTRIHGVIEELLAEGKLRTHPTYFECVTALAFEAFEVRRMGPQLPFGQQLLDHAVNPRERRREFLVADLIPIYAHALVDSFQMGGSVQTRMKSRV